MFFENNGHGWFWIPTNGIVVCSTLVPQPIPLLIVSVRCALGSQFKKLKLVSGGYKTRNRRNSRNQRNIRNP